MGNKGPNKGTSTSRQTTLAIQALFSTGETIPHFGIDHQWIQIGKIHWGGSLKKPLYMCPCGKIGICFPPQEIGVLNLSELDGNLWGNARIAKITCVLQETFSTALEQKGNVLKRMQTMKPDRTGEVGIFPFLLEGVVSTPPKINFPI